jgi:hypothetical protein
MSLLKKKILLAPILAVTLALLMAGSVSFLPQNVPQGQPTPQPTSFPNPSTAPTSPPVAQATSALNINIVSILFAVTAVLVGTVTAYLLFSEKALNKEISG